MKNEGGVDRTIRAIVGVLLVLVAFLSLSGIWQIIVYIVAVGALVTSFTGFCGLYQLLGINTARKKK